MALMAAIQRDKGNPNIEQMKKSPDKIPTADLGPFFLGDLQAHDHVWLVWGASALI
jgi:hypothetical protein